MPRTLTESRHDLIQRKHDVATVLLTRSMNDLDDLITTLAARTKNGAIRPLKGSRLAEARTVLDDVHRHGLLALAELEEANNLDAGVDAWVES